MIDTVYLGNFLECRVRVGAATRSASRSTITSSLVPQQKVFVSFQPDHGLCLTG